MTEAIRERLRCGCGRDYLQTELEDSHDCPSPVLCREEEYPSEVLRLIAREIGRRQITWRIAAEEMGIDRNTLAYLRRGERRMRSGSVNKALKWLRRSYDKPASGVAPANRVKLRLL